MMLNTVTYGEQSDLPTLLIAHGLFGSARNWGAIAKRLSDTRRVLSVDMRNHAESGWDQGHTYADMAGDLAEVIAARVRSTCWGTRWAARPRCSWR